MRFLALICSLFLTLVAGAQSTPFSASAVASHSALTNVYPSAATPFYFVTPTNGNQIELWRYVPSSVAAIDDVLVKQTKTGIGRWLMVPFTGLLTNFTAFGANTLSGTTVAADVTVANLTGTHIIATYNGKFEGDDHVAPIGALKMSVPIVVGTIDDLLALESTQFARNGIVLTNSIARNWVYVTNCTDADNGVDIRRPDDIETDNIPGRWQAVPIDLEESDLSIALDGKVDAEAGTANNLTLSGTNNVVNEAVYLLYPTASAHPLAAATMGAVRQAAPIVAADLDELLSTESAPTYQLGVVLSDTGSDGAAGDWYFSPSSSAATNAVVYRPYDRLPPSLGRWIKR